MRIALEDAVPIVIERIGNAVAGEYVAHQEEVAVGILLGTEDGADDCAGGIVDGRQEGAPWLVGTEPPVRTAVDLEQLRLERSDRVAADAVGVVHGLGRRRRRQRPH